MTEVGLTFDQICDELCVMHDERSMISGSNAIVELVLYSFLITETLQRDRESDSDNLILVQC